MTEYHPQSDAPLDPHSARAEREEKIALNGAAKPLATLALLGGAAALVLGIVLAVVAGWARGGGLGYGVSYAMYAYLLAFLFVASLGIGGLFFVLLQYLFRAGWSVNVRRVPETLAGTLPFSMLLGLPILISILIGAGTPFLWAQWSPTVHVEEFAEGHDANGSTANISDKLSAVSQAGGAGESEAHAATDESQGPASEVIEGGAHRKQYDEGIEKKRGYLNPLFGTLRLLIYGGFFAWMGRHYWRTSVRQDQSGDPELTRGLEILSGGGFLAFGFVLTFFAFDLLMSLDAHWYSTVFGVYIGAGCAVGAFATIIIILNALQREDYLTSSVSVEHYHDLGKFLFTAVFFWGYIAFSQYMLQWYANMPEETEWFLRRGATTVSADMTGWTAVITAMLFGHLLIPFAGLMSRHVKRNKGFLTFWAVWLLIFHWMDLWWLVMPELEFGGMTWVAPEVLMTLGLVGIAMWRYLTVLNQADLRPVRDPRVEESLAFMNI